MDMPAAVGKRRQIPIWWRAFVCWCDKKRSAAAHTRAHAHTASEPERASPPSSRLQRFPLLAPEDEIDRSTIDGMCVFQSIKCSVYGRPHTNKQHRHKGEEKEERELLWWRWEEA
jgi:hypothetical protein